MAVDFSEGEKNLHELLHWHSANVGEHNRNEATTRFQLIDRLFLECLGWERDDILTEERINGQFTDYSFYSPARLLIVEAKKEGLYFEIPVGDIRQKYDISYFARHAKLVGDAIAQAMDYCHSSGSPYGAVCNGHQLVAFIASRTDGLSPLMGKALVFNSLESMEANFLLLWNSLSKVAIQSRHLSQELQDIEIAPAPEKLSARIVNYPGYKGRNPMQTDLQIFSELFIEDIEALGENGREEDFLAKCYSLAGALSQYATVSKELLRARYSALFSQEVGGLSLEPATTKKGSTSQLLAEPLSRRPILLIGDRGVGKTMFIKYIYLVEAKDEFEKAVTLYIDFGSKPSLFEDLNAFVAEEIPRQLLQNYDIDIEERGFAHGVLHGDIQRFARGIYSDIRNSNPELYQNRLVEFIDERMQDKDQYLKLSLGHISKAHRKQIVVFLDNIDQRPNEFQEKVFLIGQTMAADWPVIVFISIRPETFHTSRSSGTLSAYHPRAFTIDPPRVDEVVRKRLNYGIFLLETQGLQLSLGDDVRVSASAGNLQDYLEVLSISFAENQSLMELLDNMCGGNIRLALQFVKAFVGSGHLDTAKILEIYRETNYYSVAVHEFLRAITYGDHAHYWPNASEILNLFDISGPDGREHFLSPILLAQMDRWSQDSSVDGYVSVSEIYGFLQALSYIPAQIEWGIRRLLHRNLIESYGESERNGNGELGSSHRITSVGMYYIKRLIGMFTYVDAMIVDTPVTDVDVRTRISDVYALSRRLHRAKIFCEYLGSNWEEFSGRGLALEWPTIRAEIESDIEHIEGLIDY